MFLKMQNFAVFFRFAILNEQNILFENQKMAYQRPFKMLSNLHFLTDFDEILTGTPSDRLLDMPKAAMLWSHICGVHTCQCALEANFRDFFCHTSFYLWLYVSAIKTNRLSRQGHEMCVGQC